MDQLLKQYNKSIVDVVELKKQVKKKLDKYENSLKEAKKPSHEEQDDGWIKVHHKGSRGDPKKRKKKKDDKTLLNFYAFQVKEGHIKKYKELLEKFEDDKRRLAKMREQRKFRLVKEPKSAESSTRLERKEK